MAARRAFTIIELMIVVAIIALLMTILAPSLGKARNDARRTACATNLRQVGIGLRTYLGACNDKMPYASYMPSISPLPLDGNDPIYISDVLLADVGNQVKVFQCANDKPSPDRDPPNTNKSYFDSERTSYEYSMRLMGETIEEYVRQIREHTGRVVPTNTVWIFRDFNNFHGAGGTSGSRRYLYIDGHVTDFEM